MTNTPPTMPDILSTIISHLNGEELDKWHAYFDGNPSAPEEIIEVICATRKRKDKK